MTFHQDMYRRYPKKTRPRNQRFKVGIDALLGGNYKKGLRLSAKEYFRQYKHRVKQALKVITIECTDEEIEEFYLRSQHRIQDQWNEFD